MNQYIRNYDFIQFRNSEIFPDCLDKHFIPLNDSFKLFHTNIRSISKNFDELKVYLDQFETKFHCIILTETYNAIDELYFSIHGYDLIYNHGNINKNDGVILFVKKSID